MDIVASPTAFESAESGQLSSQSHAQNQQQAAHEGPVEERQQSQEFRKPPLLKHISSPAYSSPLRHHQRNPSARHQVKESLNAHSEYITSQDDGVAEHWINQYIIKQEIGRGSFGAVHIAVDQYGHEYAVKEFSKSRLRKRAQSNILRKPLNQRRRGALQGFNSPLFRVGAGENAAVQGNSLDLIKEEIAIMKKLNHPNLVRLIEVLDDPSEDSLYMVMEMCKKGVAMRIGLEQQADPYPDDTCRYWFRDLILGIEYLHAQGVVHRDIKPDNCLITEDDVLKIVDFGVSEMFEKHSEMLTAKSAGSPAFLPPELCVVKHGDVSGKAADIWSMGVTLYCLKFGSIPFQQPQIFDLYESIKTDEPDLSRTDDPDFRDLMVRILDKNPATRIQMPELREHPWVTKGGTDPLLSEKENTADVIEPPTDAEVDAAITSNMRNLMTVMKAVQKFKNLTADRRAPVMTSILGDDAEAKFSEPPMQLPSKKHPLLGLEHRSKSAPLENRNPVETSLAVRGIHRDLNSSLDDEAKTGHVAASDPAASNNKLRAAAQPADSDDENDAALNQLHTSLGKTVEPHELPPFRSSMFHANTTDDVGHRGHAHDPLEDKLFLRIGPSTFAGPSPHSDQSGEFLPDDLYVVSESPGAADVDIYETAYRDEIERILARAQAQNKEPQVYLTRRVDAKLLQLSGLAGKLMAHGEEAKEQFKDYTQFTARRAKVAEVSKALREATKAEYEKRRQERKAWIDAAKAEKAKLVTQSPDDNTVESPLPAADSSGYTSPKPIDTTHSWRAKAFDKAFDRGMQAKSSVKGLVDLVKKTSRTKSKDDIT